MAHSFQVLTEPAEWEAIRPEVEKLGRSLPQEGTGVVFAEFDESGELASFLTLQDAVFAEMLWARDGHANLRTLWNMALSFLSKANGRDGGELVTMVANDATGEKIGSALEALGCERLPWKLYKRRI